MRLTEGERRSVLAKCDFLCYTTREEENVGFEEHVLLDHLISEGFPKRGGVEMKLCIQCTTDSSPLTL